MSTLDLRNIYKTYGKGDNEVIAVDGISIKVDKGDIIAIMGPSGCGKSTLLNILGCIDTPSQGEYYIDDFQVDFKKLNQLSKIRNEKISFIFQNFALIKDLSVLENVMLPLKFRGIARKERVNKAIKYLNELDILNLKNKSIRQLSGGQQQRVAIARALTQESEIILADEPTGALDQENSIKIMKILQELNQKHNKTILVVTHDNLVSSFCNKTLKMKDGKWDSIKL
ncbi:ABC transporter ATP-binding protein [Clostridium beijerinckii]|jgi:ABC-type antimicrobial peptide transport system, ATPase component|uniref:ABC transport system ATP-binding protein n=3 Tax=Clostridium beijerinckii TaxID=1520 RepID=A0A1S8NVE4_CLOBE|nr:ABC transporter ATP-binding protein [Clostridium beijerinckii]ABR35807.1 ABC transporter related [Clostridium beijerinckii NCIMB 8052]AIU01639.1 ABC transporter related protein [Clostridium beijerinckii ATCC 35702]MBF7809556.1 ABC transporter ATP-binding protein [Clostridium beijerinckii]NRT23156.1 putative ABC transport system ATP-binding protein [Clostridium beijerinckii]NRT36364.1 putative ABC transport system ATP-binding protein [Clostridium beijerinckii]